MRESNKIQLSDVAWLSRLFRGHQNFDKPIQPVPATRRSTIGDRALAVAGPRA